ncbi:DUF362 domain-containing protein [bacterium]|nr:DUF362 domain-containing protein [candidate division CSSED10-310 bacterium]
MHNVANGQRSSVAVVRCDSYQPDEVFQSIARGFELLGGPSACLPLGQSVLIKPNLLQAASPEAAVCVHPEVFRAVALFLAGNGNRLTYGDSPAVASSEQAARASGIDEEARKMGIPMADFKTGILLKSKERCLVKKYEIAKGVLDADAVVSISKLKTHSFTGMTGAVKNHLGCVPGLKKAEFHARFPDPSDFSRILVEIALNIQPVMHVMDGIIAMEGKGPSAGNPRKANVLLFSKDPVALDAIGAMIIGFSNESLHVLKHGKELGLGNPDNPIILGHDLAELIIDDFKHPDTRHFRDSSPAVKLFRKFLISRPVIDTSRCTRCGQCCRICPAIPKALRMRDNSSVPSLSSSLCIRCFCCQEVCPEHAIDTRTPLPGRILHNLSRN